jgi:hypothetical protein
MTGSYRKIPIDDFLIDNPEAAAVLRPGVVQPPPSWAEDEEPEPEPRTSIYRSWNFRPTEVSTSRELMPMAGPVYIWDVNGYYRAIGVPWPFRASKARLREAYRDSGGPDDEFATYAFKRLLDPGFRKRYDARPFGQPMDDKYRWAALKRQAAQWAAAETVKQHRPVSSGEFVPPDIRAKMDADLRREREGDVAPPAESVETGWGFGYFIWDAFHRDEAVLSQWQRMLLEACWERGVRGRFAVGVMGGQPCRAARTRYDGQDVAFLDEDQEPTAELAGMVVESYLTAPLNSRFDVPLTFDLDNSDLSTRVVAHVLIDPSAEERSPTPEELSMSDDEEMLDFASGGLQAAEFAKAAAAARKAMFGSAPYVTQFLQDDGDQVILRFLTDEPLWIETLQHGMVKTKPAPKDKPADKGWPETLSAVCRYTPVGADRHRAFNDCYICDYVKDDKGKRAFAGTRLWALAALREPVIGTQEMVEAKQIQPHMVGQQVSYRDKTEEVDELDDDNKPTGKKVQRKQIVIVNMAQSNFFSPLLTNRVFFGTVVDRDYLVVRKGAKKTQKVQYEFVALNPVHVKHPESGETVVFDLRDPKLAAAYEGHGMDLAKLRKHVNRLCSKKFYDRFFDPRVEVPYIEDDDSAATPAASAEAQSAQQSGQSLTSEPTSGVTAEQLAAMRANLLADNPPPASQDAPTVVSPL